MIPTIKNILYCTKIGPNSPYIFEVAVAMAKAHGAKIHALHVMETLSPKQEALVDGYVGKGVLHNVVEHEEETAEARLRSRIRAHCARDLGNCDEFMGEIIITEGHKVDVILDHVKKLNADMLVIGASSEKTFLHNIIGDTARMIISRCPVPVLSVQVPDDKQEPGISEI